MYSTQNFKLKKGTGVGNCLFRSMSQAIYQTEHFHELIRKEIVNYVRRNWENQKEWIGHIHQIHDLNTYCNFMLISKGPNVTYGTEYETYIFSRIFNKPITILRKNTENETYETLIEIDESTTNDSRQKIYLLFSGDSEKRTGHYDLLYLNTSNITELTNQLNDKQLFSQITCGNSGNETSNNNKNNTNEIQLSPHYERNKSTNKFNVKNNRDIIENQQNTQTNNQNSNKNLPVNYKKRKFTHNITDNIENKINNTNCSHNEKVLNKYKINNNFNKQSNNLIKSTTNNNYKTDMKPVFENCSQKRDIASLSPKSYINSNNTIGKTYDIQNFKLVTINNDNNCLFRAMSYAIYKSDIYHELMKYEILKYVTNNWENEKDIIKHIYNINNKNNYHDYISK